MCCSVGAGSACGDSDQDELNCCHTFMSARGTWRVGQAQSYHMSCVGTNAQEVTRCSDYEQAFQEKGVREEGGPRGRWGNLAANCVLLLFLSTAQE